MFNKRSSYVLESLFKGHQPKTEIKKPILKAVAKVQDFKGVFKGARSGMPGAGGVKGGGGDALSGLEGSFKSSGLRMDSIQSDGMGGQSMHVFDTNSKSGNEIAFTARAHKINDDTYEASVDYGDGESKEMGSQYSSPREALHDAADWAHGQNVFSTRKSEPFSSVFKGARSGMPGAGGVKSPAGANGGGGEAPPTKSQDSNQRR